MANRETLAALRQLWDACGSVSWTQSDELRLELAKPVALSLLAELRDQDFNPVFTDRELQKDLDLGRNREAGPGSIVDLRVPRIPDRLVVARHVADLLSLSKTCEQEPTGYALCGHPGAKDFQSHCQGDESPTAPPLVRRYHQAVDLWQALARQAACADTTDGSLLYFGSRRTKIVPGFSISDLAEDIATERIVKFLENPDQLETRREIFDSALSEFLRDIDSASAFSRLLRGSAQFAARLKEGMAIFLAEHSPQKLTAEARRAALDLSEKLEKIIGGLEAKSLAIPAALLLAIKEVDPGAGYTALNVFLLAATATYGLTMTFVHLSQRALLSLLRTTIEKTEEEFKERGLDKDNSVLKTWFKSLKRRRSVAAVGSWAMFLASWVPAACVWGALSLGTPKSSSRPPTQPSRVGQVVPFDGPKTTKTSATAATPLTVPDQTLLSHSFSASQTTGDKFLYADAPVASTYPNLLESPDQSRLRRIFQKSGLGGLSRVWSRALRGSTTRPHISHRSTCDFEGRRRRLSPRLRSRPHGSEPGHRHLFRRRGAARDPLHDEHAGTDASAEPRTVEERGDCGILRLDHRVARRVGDLRPGFPYRQRAVFGSHRPNRAACGMV